MLSAWWHLVLRRLCAGALAVAVALPGIAAVHFEGQQWDASMSTRVRTALAWEREREHLRQLGDQLAQRWSVDVDRRRVADFSARGRERLLAGRGVAR